MYYKKIGQELFNKYKKLDEQELNTVVNRAASIAGITKFVNDGGGNKKTAEFEEFQRYVYRLVEEGFKEAETKYVSEIRKITTLKGYSFLTRCNCDRCKLYLLAKDGKEFALDNTHKYYDEDY